MDIAQFKEDDVITRVQPVTPNGDRSYQGDKLQFVGVEAGMIVLIRLDESWMGEIVKLETDWWSEGWGYYPQNLIEKAISKVKQMVTTLK